jgi:hypothetical protein
MGLRPIKVNEGALSADHAKSIIYPCAFNGAIPLGRWFYARGSASCRSRPGFRPVLHAFHFHVTHAESIRLLDSGSWILSLNTVQERGCKGLAALERFLIGQAALRARVGVANAVQAFER